MCEMLFTSDGDFFSRLSEQEQRQFFIDCFEFAENRYGRENIIAATVHLDEATPHLHLDFVPLNHLSKFTSQIFRLQMLPWTDSENIFTVLSIFQFRKLYSPF